MPRLHSEVCDKHLPRTGTDFRLLRKSASRSTDGRRLPIRQPGGERAETAVSRLDRRRQPLIAPSRSSTVSERVCGPAYAAVPQTLSPIIPATKHRDRLGRAARRIPIPVWPERHGTTFVRRASDQAGPDGFRLKHDAKSLGELSRDKPGKRARRNLIPARKPPKIRKS